jgi:drug/metabolite transporter (DMT)-like permease
MGGFSIPEVHDEFRDPQRVTRAWLYCVMMFLAGAGCVSIVDHFVGTIDRSNIRLLYIIIGVALMIGSYLWQRGVRTDFAATVSARRTR